MITELGALMYCSGLGLGAFYTGTGVWPLLLPTASSPQFVRPHLNHARNTPPKEGNIFFYYTSSCYIWFTDSGGFCYTILNSILYIIIYRWHSYRPSEHKYINYISENVISRILPFVVFHNEVPMRMVY